VVEPIKHADHCDGFGYGSLVAWPSAAALARERRTRPL
jgi:hypothetical protein